MIHVYWAMGGKSGMKAVLPETKHEGKPLFMPTPFTTLVVAMLLFIAAVIVLEPSGILPAFLPEWMIRLGLWTLAFVFLLRSLGDFRYIGFSKRVYGTTFAKFDTWLYSPLTLLLGLGCLLLALQPDVR
jgi:glucan phosphoethanolaminetransferase (alkaline phosphatase superfamily)